MSKQSTYITYYHFTPENHIGKGLVACNMGDPLKSREWGRVDKRRGHR